MRRGPGPRPPRSPRGKGGGAGGGAGRVQLSLLIPREPPGQPVDAASRDAFIAHQSRRGHRLRRLRRALRLAGAAAGAAVVLLAVAITGVAGAHAVRRSGLLAVADLSVVGARRIPEATLRAAAAIEPGTDLLAIDPEAVVDRLEAVPGILRASIVRHLPNRVVITVEEREPWALVNLSGPNGATGLVWVDADGHLVAPERHGAMPSLPILSGVEPPPAGAGEPVGDRLQAGLTLLRALKRAGGLAAERVSEVDLEPADGPILYMVDGTAVWLGREGWDERLARLDAVLGRLAEQEGPVESVDLRFRDLVVLRPRSANPPAEKGR
jgi:cell division septal protein FtsQ